MTFNIYTLGCKVNTYESNALSHLLNKYNYIEVTTNEIANISIINTCTVTNTADHKSIKTIKQAIRNNPNAIIIVIGCLTQISVEIVKNIPGVSIILGNRNKNKITNYIEEFKLNNKQIIDIENINDKKFENMLIGNFNKTRAFVKIQDGCNNYCSYCIIPYSRGNIVSRDKDEILKEINSLVNNGHKEIVLTGIHTGHYGTELGGYNFANLLNDILKIKNLERLRISSIEMNEITSEVLEIIKNNKVLVNHMHIPLQSGSDLILKLMNRKYSKKEFIDKIAKIREVRPDISITTDIIIGFPGETEELFNETLETAKLIKFAKIHVFPFSKREGTKAALMSDQIDEKIKKERVKVLIETSKDLEINYMEKFINKEITFLPEVYKDGYLIGHTSNYLTIKALGEKNKLNINTKVKITNIGYPYCIALVVK